MVLENFELNLFQFNYNESLQLFLSIYFRISNCSYNYAQFELRFVEKFRQRHFDSKWPHFSSNLND